jgi:rubrerythrin
MKLRNLAELLYQALETELGGEQLYRAAIENAVDADVKEEWTKYLEETRTHQEILKKVFAVAGLDPATESIGRRIVRSRGQALVAAIEVARQADDPKLGELVAAECIVEAESKDHQNWTLLGLLAEHLDGALRETIQGAFDEVSDQEAEHLFHSMGWARELWLDFAGAPAVLPPPEEEKHVKTQIGAAQAGQPTASDRV